MKTNKYFIGLLIAALPCLLLLLGWNCMQLYRFEKKQLQEKVEAAVRYTAATVQNYNGSLVNNMALMLSDKEFNEKVAFAAGFTHNMGKLAVHFNRADTTIKQSQRDSIPVIDKQYLQTHKITYKQQAIMTSSQFDALLRLDLEKKGLSISYEVKGFERNDTAVAIGYVSPPFILDFTNPDIYCIRYTLPPSLIWKGITPYFVSSILIYLLLVSGIFFYYRSYQAHQRITRFRAVLFGNFAHELKTPVTSLQLIVDGARSNAGGTDTVLISMQYLHFADSELKRMKLLIDKILSFSKMDRRQFEFNKEIVDIGAVISEAIGIMQVNIEQMGAKVSYVSPDRTVTIGDRTLLLNAIVALLDNALKYSGTPPDVAVELRSESGYAVVSIRDNGPGIHSVYAKKIFEPFFRVPTGNVHNIPGHGLGLSFVAEALKLHGSSIQLTTDANGTIFHFRLATA